MKETLGHKERFGNPSPGISYTEGEGFLLVLTFYTNHVLLQTGWEQMGVQSTGETKHVEGEWQAGSHS